MTKTKTPGTLFAGVNRLGCCLELWHKYVASYCLIFSLLPTIMPSKLRQPRVRPIFVILSERGCSSTSDHPVAIRHLLSSPYLPDGLGITGEWCGAGGCRPHVRSYFNNRSSKNTANITNLCEKCKSYLKPTTNLFSRGLTCSSSSEQLTYLCTKSA